MKGQRKGDLKKILAKAAKDGLALGPLGTTLDSTQFISTGNIAIDFAVGGGVPLGRSVEFYGFPSCGKTTTALQAAATLQKIIMAGGDPEREIEPGDKILYLDYEHALDKDYALALGLDPYHESFIIGQPDTLEEGANYAIDLIETGEIRMLIVDSIASMMPSSKAEAEIGKSLPAIRAKLVGDFMEKMTPILHNYNCAGVYLNQLKEVMDMGGRRPGMPARTSTPGGVSLKFFSSVRLEYTKIRDNKEDVLDELTSTPTKVVESTDVAVKVTKNKLGTPGKVANVRVRFGRGFDNFYTAIQILIGQKKIVKTGAYYYLHRLEAADLALVPDWIKRATTGQQRPYIMGDHALMKAADEHPEWRDEIIRYTEWVVQHLTEIPVIQEESEEE